MMTVIPDTNRVHYIRYLHFVDMATAEIKMKKNITHYRNSYKTPYKNRRKRQNRNPIHVYMTAHLCWLGKDTSIEIEGLH